MKMADQTTFPTTKPKDANVEQDPIMKKAEIIFTLESICNSSLPCTTPKQERMTSMDGHKNGLHMKRIPSKMQLKKKITAMVNRACSAGKYGHEISWLKLI